MSGIPCRRRRHRPAGSRTGVAASLGRGASRRLPASVDLRGLDRHALDPCGRGAGRSGSLPSCHARSSCPDRRAELATFDRELARLCAPFSPRSRLSCVRQHAVGSASKPAPETPTRLAVRRALRTRDASDRLLPSHFFVRAPVPRRLPVRPRAHARAPRGIACHHVRAIRFGGPHQGHLSTATGVVFPSWRVRSSLWHPCRFSHLGSFARAKMPR